MKRAAIVALARRLADEGAHYLWGAEGQKPGDGGLKLAAPVLDPSQPGKTMFCAGVLGGCVCVGRFKAKGFNARVPRDKPRVWDPASPIGRDDVVAFINRVKSSPSSQVGWGDDLTPRSIGGYPDPRGVPTDYGGAGPLLGKVVWGEGCDDTQHFDCGGFVRWVAKQVCGVSIAGISGDPCPKNPHGQPLGFKLKKGDDMLPGDILVYKGHIAFADAGNGKYSPGASFDIVQAEDAVSGVNYTKGRADMKPRAGDIKCIRISPSTLLNRKIDAP